MKKLILTLILCFLYSSVFAFQSSVDQLSFDQLSFTQADLVKIGASPTVAPPPPVVGWDISDITVAQWKMNDNAASTAVDDEIDAAEGTLVGGDNTTDLSEAGKVSLALHLDGSADYISVDDLVTVLANHTTGSMAFWAKIDVDTADDRLVFSLARDVDNDNTLFFVDYYMVFDRLEIKLALDGTTQFHLTTPTDSLDPYVGDWVFIVITQDGTKPKIYLNTVEQTLTSIDATNTTKWFKAIITDATSKVDNATIGVQKRNSATAFFFDGVVDVMLITDDVLTQTEIDGLYNNGDGTENLESD